MIPLPGWRRSRWSIPCSGLSGKHRKRRPVGSDPILSVLPLPCAGKKPLSVSSDSGFLQRIERAGLCPDVLQKDRGLRSRTLRGAGLSAAPTGTPGRSGPRTRRKTAGRPGGTFRKRGVGLCPRRNGVTGQPLLVGDGLEKGGAPAGAPPFLSAEILFTPRCSRRNS